MSARHSQPYFRAPETYLSQIANKLVNPGNSIDCSLCYETTSFVGVGACGHSEICWLCSLRLRWICKDTSCAICKEPLPSLRISPVGPPGLRSEDTSSASPFSLRDVEFASADVFQEASKLVSFVCPYPCGEDPSFHFKSLSDLQTHLKRDHEGAIYCSICLDHRQCFLPEQPLFGPNDLLAHTKSEHPSCDFCAKDRKFYSIDELLAHMNQAHFKCVVCDRLDHRNEYYANFDSLDQHFEEAHYRCEYPECREQRFVVFGEEEDLRLHWLEKHGRGRAIPLGGSSSIGGPSSRKKTRNRNSQTPVNLVIHFRGPRIPNTQLSLADERLARETRYPDVPSGNRYDRRVHANVLVGRPGWMNSLASEIGRAELVQSGSQAYHAANVGFLKQVSEAVPKEQVWELKAVSVKFTQGTVNEYQFLTTVKQLIAKLDEKKAVALMVDLIRLMPDVSKRDSLMSYLKRPSKPKREHTEVRQVGRREDNASVPIEIPDTLFEPGSKKPCLIQALHAVLEQGQFKTVDIPQSILAAMENKINALDRVQLSTLSEMRNQLLTLAEGRLKSSVSWNQTDSILALRPLLYRVMQIPETHKSRERQLLASGWKQFVEATQNALSKFNATEIGWMKVYVSLSVLRMGNMGVTETRRHDFPSLPMSAYFPSMAGSEPQAPASLPTRTDFPVGLPVAPPIASILPTAASSTQWRNSRQARRDEAFPELAPSLAGPAENKVDLTKPWACPRCTYVNTRHLSRTCEICGMERPPPGEESTTPDETISSANGASNKPRRSKQKIILSSSTQRDYTR